MKVQPAVTQLVLTSLGVQSVSLAIDLLAERLGNRNHNKALRLARQIIEEGKVKPAMADRLAALLSIEPTALRTAISADHQLQSESARNVWFHRVGPHLLVKTTGRNFPLIVAHMLFGDLRIIGLPCTIANLTWPEQKRVVRGAINLYKSETWDGGEKKMDRTIQVYGAITGFMYCPAPDKSFRFSVDGRFDSLNQGVAGPETRFAIKQRSLDFL